MEPRYEFSYTFDLAFVRRALRRDHSWKYLLGPGLLLPLLVASRLIRGTFDPLVVGTVVAGIVFLTWFVHFKYARGTQAVFDFWSKLSPDHTMRFRLDDEGFDLLLESSEARYEWSGLRRLWRYDDVWLIEIVKNVSAFFPPDVAPTEAREFIVDRCRAAGVRI